MSSDVDVFLFDRWADRQEEEGKEQDKQTYIGP
jgi:hypothetical protein